MNANRPWFLWDVDLGVDEFRARLAHADPRVRAQWQGVLMREATVAEVWTYLRVADVQANWENIRRHLGRRLAFWEWLFDAWKRNGLLDLDGAAARSPP